MAIEELKTEPAQITVDNPQAPKERTPEEQAKIKKLEEYTQMVNDESPQWYSLIGTKGSSANERFRPVNIFPEWSGIKDKEVPTETPVFAVERSNPPAAFKRKCEDFVKQFQKADAPPSNKPK